MSIGIRQQAGAALLRFAVERSIDRQEMERRLDSVAPPGTVEHANAQATLAAARWFESAVLWVGWRLHGPHLMLPEAEQFST